MAQYTVDSFIVELGFSEKVIKGLQRVEKMSMQAAQRIERNINKAFDVWLDITFTVNLYNIL